MGSRRAGTGGGPIDARSAPPTEHDRSLLQDAAYWSYRAGERLAGLLPDRALPTVAAVSGTVGWAVLPGRRVMVRRHLDRVVDGGSRSRGPLVRAAFRSYARYWLDTFRVGAVDPADLDRRATVDGLEHVDRALAGGRGAILALPHMGSWEQAGAWLAHRGYVVTVVMERLPRRLREWFVEVREQVGMEVLVRGPQVWDELEDALARNHLIGLVSDRDLGGRGVPVRFFGEETTLPAGPGRLAVGTGAPLLPVGVYMEPGRRWSAVVRPPIAIPAAPDERSAVAAVTGRLARELEGLIRRAPTQWHLMQPNWPSDRG